VLALATEHLQAGHQHEQYQHIEHDPSPKGQYYYIHGRKTVNGRTDVHPFNLFTLLFISKIQINQ
jgi:hypothetical protein